MPLNKVSTQTAIASPTMQPTPAEAAPAGPSRAPTSTALESLRSAPRALAQAGTGLVRRTALLTAATVSNTLMTVAGAGFHPAVSAAAAEGARHPQPSSGDGSNTHRVLGIMLAAGVGGVLGYLGYQAYQRITGSNSAQAAPPAPAAAPAAAQTGSADNV
jgi:hypothetical protein